MPRILALSVVTLLAFSARAEQVVYAQGNFYLHKGELSAINYRTGTVIPVGAKVAVLKTNDNEVHCRVLDTGFEFDFVSHKSLGRNAKDLFRGFFSENDPSPKVGALPAERARHVRAGELELGMTREEVLLAFGPPPPHKTASLDSSLWTYWKSKMAKYEVEFDDAGKVIRLGEAEKSDKPNPLAGLFAKKEEAPKEVLFARGNLHHAEGVVSWVNYQYGPIIPFNSRVEVLNKGGKSVKFRLAGEDKEYTFENDERSGKDAWAMFLVMFAPDDQAAELAKLSAKDRKLVAAAEVKPGMSRRAVMMAWGPPPPHQTASFDSSTWTYWRTKTVKAQLTFDEGDKLENVH